MPASRLTPIIDFQWPPTPAWLPSRPMPFLRYSRSSGPVLVTELVELASNFEVTVVHTEYQNTGVREGCNPM